MKDFSKFGRVNYTLRRRLELLAEVQRLAESIEVEGVRYLLSVLGGGRSFVFCLVFTSEYVLRTFNRYHVHLIDAFGRYLFR